MKAKTFLIPQLQRTGSTLTRFGMLLCMLLVLRPVLAQTNYTPYTFTSLSGLSSAGFKDDTNNNSRFSNPCGIAIDSSRNLYVADAMNNSIRMISPVGTNWVVTTIAGTGFPGTNDGPGNLAQFNHPENVTVDTNSCVYVADGYNATIRRIVPSGSNWVVSTIAGSPRHPGAQNGTNDGALFRGPGGLVLDNSGNIYVADAGNNAIRQIVPNGSNWVVSTFAGFLGQLPPGGTNDGTGTMARFNNPIGITRATNGNFFVADLGNMVPRIITPSAVVSTPIGTAGVYGSADGTNKAASFSQFFSIASDSSGNLYIPDTYNDTIRKITQVGTNWVVTTIAGTVKFAGSQDGTNSSALFCEPFGVTADQAGNVYVADGFNNTIRKLSLSGTNWVATTIAGLPGSTGTNDGALSSAKYFFPGGVAVDASGNAYVADSGNDTIRLITAAGTSRTIAGTPQVSGGSDGTNSGALFYNPTGVAVDPYTNIYVADTYNGKIRKISAVGTNWVVSSIASGFFHPMAVAVDSSSNVYVADTYNALVRKISPSGTNWVTRTLTNSTHFYDPAGIAVDPKGNVYVSDQYLSSVYELSWNGSDWSSTLLAGSGSLDVSGDTDGTNNAARFNTPNGIAIDAAGNLYIADSYNCTIRRATPSGTNWVVTTLAGTGVAPPGTFGVAGGSDGTGTNAEFDIPLGVAVDAYGTVYVADNYNNTIRKGWAVGTPPNIVLGSPTISGGQVQFGFRLASGTATSFELLQADELTGPWTTNSSAILSTNVPGVSFNATVPIGGSSEFYRIQTP